MKVAIVTTYADKIMVSRRELIQALLDKGHTITVLGCEPEEKCKPLLDKFNIEYRKIPFVRSNTNPFEEMRVIYNAARTLKSLDLEALLIYGVRLAASFTISSKLSGIKRTYAIINGAGTLFNMEGLKGKLARSISYPLLFLGLRLCNKVIFQNIDNQNLFINQKLVRKNRTFTVNGSGVNLDKFKPRPLPSEHVFLFIGRLIRDKGVSEFITAAQKIKELYPESKFLIIGPYDENLTALSEEELKPLIHGQIIQHIPWTDKIDEYLSKCYTFVLPSYHEGTPRTVLEAMAMGRPIITTDAPGCRETVIDGVNGFLVPVKNSDAVVEKVKWMIENREEAEKMGQESLRLCKEKFDVNKVNEAILKIIDL